MRRWLTRLDLEPGVGLASRRVVPLNVFGFPLRLVVLPFLLTCHTFAARQVRQVDHRLAPGPSAGTFNSKNALVTATPPSLIKHIARLYRIRQILGKYRTNLDQFEN